MTTNVPDSSLRDETIEDICINFQGSRLEEREDIREIIDIVFNLIVKRLDKKIAYCNKCLKEPRILMEDCSYDCMDSKKKAFQEVKLMLKVKENEEE